MEKGWPLSYRHFVYGMAWIARDDNRRLLRDASASRAGGATDQSFKRWRREIIRGI